MKYFWNLAGMYCFMFCRSGVSAGGVCLFLESLMNPHFTICPVMHLLFLAAPFNRARGEVSLGIPQSQTLGQIQVLTCLWSRCWQRFTIAWFCRSKSVMYICFADSHGVYLLNLQAKELKALDGFSGQFFSWQICSLPAVGNGTAWPRCSGWFFYKDGTATPRSKLKAILAVADRSVWTILLRPAFTLWTL